MVKEMVEIVKKEGFYKILDRANEFGYDVGILVIKMDEEKCVVKVAVLDKDDMKKYWSVQINMDEFNELKEKYDIYVLRQKIEELEE